MWKMRLHWHLISIWCAIMNSTNFVHHVIIQWKQLNINSFFTLLGWSRSSVLPYKICRKLSRVWWWCPRRWKHYRTACSLVRSLPCGPSARTPRSNPSEATCLICWRDLSSSRIGMTGASHTCSGCPASSSPRLSWRVWCRTLPDATPSQLTSSASTLR